MHFKSNTYTLLLFSLILPFCAYSQKRVIDEKDNTAVSYAHILLDNRIFTYSDDNGEFEIDARQKFDTLKIAHLSYETLALSHADFLKTTIITLKAKSNELEEVTINVSKKKKKSLTLLPDKSMRDKLYSTDNFRLVFEMGNTLREDGTPADEIHISRAVYVPNEKQIENAVIKKIILTSIPRKKPGDDRYAPFKVNLMTYDTINHLPKDKIFAEDLPAGKKRGETAIIDLSKEEPVYFPKEGICVVVSVYDTVYYATMGNMMPPSFKPALIPKTSSFREYSFGLTGDYWEEQSYSKERTQCFDFGIEIEFYK